MLLNMLLTGHPLRAVRQVRMAWTLRFPSQPLRLHLGCGQRHLEGFINIDRNHSWAVDYAADITRLPCRRNSVGRIESYHVIEHIPHPQVLTTVREWYDMLIPGGIVVAECPDFDATIRQYLTGDQECLYSVYGRQRFPGDAHCYGYNAARLTELFQQAGFTSCLCSPGTDYHVASEPCLRIEATKPLEAGGKRPVSVSGRRER